jgi:hypothetical protein
MNAKLFFVIAAFVSFQALAIAAPLAAPLAVREVEGVREYKLANGSPTRPNPR